MSGDGVAGKASLQLDGDLDPLRRLQPRETGQVGQIRARVGMPPAVEVGEERRKRRRKEEEGGGGKKKKKGGGKMKKKGEERRKRRRKEEEGGEER